MDNVVNVWVFLEDLVESGLILDIQLVELWPLAADQLDAVDDLFRRVVEVVNDDNLVASLEEGESRERANVACATAVDQQAAVTAWWNVGWRGSFYPVTRTDLEAIVRLVEM